MSDLQPNDTSPEEIDYKGGWKKPAAAGGWQTPQSDSAESQPIGWTAPAMPADLRLTPDSEGAWHLPRPEDTSFGLEDEIEITSPATSVRPEDTMLLVERETTSAPEVEETIEEDTPADLESYSGLGDLVASLTSIIETQPKPDILPGSDDDDQETLEAQEVEDESEALDFGSPTQAEREALEQAASDATEIHPADFARQRVDWLTEEDAGPDGETAAAVDPEAYARQQIEALQSGQNTEATPTEIVPEEAGTDDPAAYARQQIAELSGEAAPTEPEPAAPEVDELSQKFQETERQVRALRQQYRDGTITRDQLQQQLRQYLVLDDNENWWMMGVDTDTWYRYDNTKGDWVMDTPPIVRKPGVPTATSEFTPEDVLQGQLPYLPDDDEVSDVTEDTAPTHGTEPIYLDTDSPLPRSVPIEDPDATIPGNVAINQSTTRLSEAETLDNFGAEPTIRAQPVNTTPYQPTTAYDAGFDTIAAEPPAYDDLDSETPSYQQAVERQRQSNLRRLLLALTLVLGGIFIIGTIAILLTVASYNNIAASYREQIAALENYQPDFQTVRVLDVAGNQIAELNSEQGGSRESISLTQMSPDLIYAIVGSQDPNYYETPGFDTIAIAGAFFQSLGGGTPRPVDNVNITQQVANLVIANSDSAATATRLDQIIVASEIARQYDKNFILELYLNEQFFGNQSYGVEAASEFYYEKPASEVTLAEGAMLASLLEEPVDNDPVPKENRVNAFAAADATMRELATVGCLNFQHGQYANGGPYCVQNSQILRPNGDFTANINLERAEVQVYPYRPRSVEGDYPHFVDFVRRELIREYGNDMFRLGFEVRTTLDSDIQDVAQRALRDQLRTQAFTGLETGAVMVVEPESGQILAMVGSPDFNDEDIDGDTNYAFTWQLPGATVMPIVYTRALEGVGDRNGNGAVDYNEYLTAASILFDLPPDFQDPNIRTANSGGQYRGAIPVRQALANSVNVAAIKVYNYIGNENYLDIARRMGLTFLNDPPVLGYQTATGEATETRLWDMMKAYGVLANTGRFVPLRTILEIRDSDGQTVALTEGLAPRQPAQVVSPQASFLVQNILSDSQFYENTFDPLFLPNYPNRTAVKINHINDNRDMWAMGFSRNVVVGVWMGRVDTAATVANSREAALPVWTTVMQAALDGSNPVPFNSPPSNVVQPGSIQNLVICAPTGTLPGADCTQQRNEFFAITNPPPPPEQGPVVAALVDSWTQLIANEFCPDNVVQEQFVDLHPDDPYAINWLNTAAGRPTANRMGLPQNVRPMPASACELNTDLPVARITSPAEGTSVMGTVSILGVASANNFDSYQLEYAPVGSNTFTIFAGPVRNQQPNQNSTLGEWNTNTVTNGQYVIRLTMFSTSGGFIRRDVTVNVLNPTPTPMPTPTTAPQPTIVLPTTTTLPFPTPFAPSPQIQTGDATPTATLFFGG